VQYLCNIKLQHFGLVFMEKRPKPCINICFQNYKNLYHKNCGESSERRSVKIHSFHVPWLWFHIRFWRQTMKYVSHIPRQKLWNYLWLIGFLTNSKQFDSKLPRVIQSSIEYHMDMSLKFNSFHSSFVSNKREKSWKRWEDFPLHGFYAIRSTHELKKYLPHFLCITILKYIMLHACNIHQKI